MVAREKSVFEVGSNAESGWSEVSDNSSTCGDLEASSIASDQDRFDTACETFRDLTDDLYYIDLRRYSCCFHGNIIISKVTLRLYPLYLLTPNNDLR